MGIPITEAAAPAPAPALPSPASEVVAAHKAILRVKPDDRRHVQFFTIYHMTDEQLAEFLPLFSFHVNSLSTRPNLKRPVRVHPTLLLIDRRWYGWKRAVVNKLADVDPHFHARVKVDGKVETVNAPWLDPVLITDLVALTRVEVPILRADWFFRETATSKGKLTGYYAFLGLKNRADFDRLVGFDKKLAQASFKEVAAIVQSSGVSQLNRQIFRFGAADGGYWQTRDRIDDNETDAGNAINQLDEDYVHQAEELYGALPNDLFAMHLNDAAGVQQTTAPDGVGPDSTSSSNDGKIHAYLSCVRCHTEGLRPIKDYARKLFRGRRKLVVTDGDQKRLERLEQLYLKDYERKRKADNLKYAAALAALNGEEWTPAKNAQAMGEVWKRWNDDKVSRAEMAREIGLSESKFAAALERYGRPLDEGGAGQVVPPTLLAYVPAEEGEKPLSLLRQHADEHYGLAFLIGRGIVPGLEPARTKPPAKKVKR